MQNGFGRTDAKVRITGIGRMLWSVWWPTAIMFPIEFKTLLLTCAILGTCRMCLNFFVRQKESSAESLDANEVVKYGEKIQVQSVRCKWHTGTHNPNCIRAKR